MRMIRAHYDPDDAGHRDADDTASRVTQISPRVYGFSGLGG